MRRAFSLVSFLVLACGARSGVLFTDGTDAGGVDASDDAGPPPPPPICVALDGDGLTRIEIAFAMRIETADVLFLVDATSSMRDEIDEIRQRLKDTIAPGIANEIRNVRFAVAYLGDFPVEGYGRVSDRPFGLLERVTNDLDRVEAAVDMIPFLSGEDSPESQVEALYQSATGEGLGDFIPPASCPPETRGYPCFRPSATPILMLFTDASFHNGPGGVNPYSGITPRPHTYREAADALRALGARVIGLDSGVGMATPDLEAIAFDTGAVTGAGMPLVFDIGGRGESLDERVIESIQVLSREVPIDVAARAEDMPGDEVNALVFVVSLTALRAEPPEGIAWMEGAAFGQVAPGTTVVFELVLDENVLPRLSHVREHWLRVVLVGDDVTPLAERVVVIRLSGTEEDAVCDDID